MEIPDYEPFYLDSLDALRAEIDRLGLGLEIPVGRDHSVLSAPLPGTAILNRLCAQPISGLDANADGTPGPLTRRRYRRLAEGGFGVVWVESTTAGPSAPPGKLRLHDDTLEAFRELVDELREAARGSRAQDLTLILQLGIALAPDSRVQPTPDDPAGVPLLSDGEIESHLCSLVHAAGLVARAGFDGVDLQACDGALPAALLAAFHREGHFGGSFENRTRFLREAIVRIRAAFPDLLLATRLGVYHAICPPHGFGTDSTDYRRPDFREPEQLVAMLHAAGLDLLNVTSCSPRLRGPAAARRGRPIPDHGIPDEHPLMVLARQLRLARVLRGAAPGLPVIGSGFSWLRNFLPQVGAAAVANNTMDIVGIGRGALACPDAPARIFDGHQLDPGATCMVCFACDTMREGGGPVGCPIRDPETYGIAPRPRRPVDPGQLDREARRCHLCEAAPCVGASRTGTEIPAFIDSFRRGDESRAYRIIRRSDVLPEMTSHLTPGWLHSERACIEAALTGVPVPILDLQHAIAWRARHRGEIGVLLPACPSGRVVAVVGAGPAGLAATIRLLEQGHTVDLFERSDTLGGTPERVIPSTRFPSARPEIDAILAPALVQGRLRLHQGKTLGHNLDLDGLCGACDAVLLAAGLWQEGGLAGRRPDGVLDALEFLEAVKRGERTSAPSRVAILAGGDCAMDAARTAQHLGASEIFIVFGGARSAMHWHMSDSWFAEPGHHAMMHCQPLGYQTGPHHRLQALRIDKTGAGGEELLEAGLVVEAMGLQMEDALQAALPGVAINDYGLVATIHGSRTTRPGVYVAGGLVNGGASVARCVAEGMKAAGEIHDSFRTLLGHSS